VFFNSLSGLKTSLVHRFTKLSGPAIQGGKNSTFCMATLNDWNNTGTGGVLVYFCGGWSKRLRKAEAKSRPMKMLKERK
jgi:hypothetical protein